jgi:hypothetical protein
MGVCLMPGGKVRRQRSVGRTVEDVKRRRKRPCATAPKVPANLAVAFLVKEVHHREVWRARVTFDAVTLDVADRPLAPERYAAQLRYTNASGVPITIGGASDDVRRGFIDADDTPLKIVFEDLSRPKSWYVQVRVRTMNRVRGQRCYSAWSSWTTATQPSSGALAGPPAPSGLVLTFDKVEAGRGKAWRAKARLNQSGQWTPTDGDPVDIENYIFQLAVSSQSDGTPLLNTRRGVMVEHDEEQTTARREFRQILGKRWYRVRAKARALGRSGAWTSWTAWASPGGAPAPPTGLTWSNPNRSLLTARWTEPVDLTDVDRYKVEVIRASDSAVVDTGFTGGTRWTYHIPKADRNINHRVRVRSIEDPGTLDVDEDTPVGWDTAGESSTVTSSDVADTAVIIGELRNDNDKPLIRKTGYPRVRLNYAAGGTLTAGTDTFIRFGTMLTDTDGFWTSATGELDATPDSTYDITVPFDGQYVVFFSANFAAGTGQRHWFWDKNGAGGARHTETAVGAATAHRSEFNFVFDAFAGDAIRVGVQQSSGAGLVLTAAGLYMEYRGDA